MAIVIQIPFEHSNRTRQSEAKTYVAAMNRAQQAYFLENSFFAGNVDSLELGIPIETEYYTYSINLQADRATVQNIGQSKRDDAKSYIGLVWVTHPESELSPFAILCEDDQPSAAPVTEFKPIEPGNQITDVNCPPGYVDVNLLFSTKNTI
ncbi:general secretion pathway protein H [Thalassoporum mexicanum PCC 7367]|nr:type IV pilin-like G/H family protein [Pseudanabaena sp. PCC 7367]AFY70870.1 general secretion pathway protein H [Pseudanabaena sp. PCC 7367]